MKSRCSLNSQQHFLDLCRVFDHPTPAEADPTSESVTQISTTTGRQVNLLNEEITLAELEIYDGRIEELDLEAALNFAVSALSNAAAFWNQCSPEQKPRFQRVLFPDGLVFDGESYRTATTCLAFSYLREFSKGNSSLASRTGVEPVSPP